MPEQIDRIFADRRRRARQGRVGSVVLSALFHGALTVGFIFLPALFASPKPQLEYVSVLVVPPSVLGIEEPPPPPPPRTPPAPPQAAPPPPPPPADVPVLRTEKKKPRTRPAPPPPAAPPRLQSDRPPRRQGSTTGQALGAANSQATLGVEDPNFTYGWYLDQVVNRITGNWTRPLVGPEARALFYFRIQRDGTITDLALTEPSGFDEFDAAARRAVEASSPLPPLPRAYKPAFLGINLIVK